MRVVTQKVIRKPREWDEKCDRCSGTGTVHRKQHFALWTPDEWSHVQPITDGRVPADAYVCTVAAGASINDSCIEGVQIAALVNRPVAFEFNGMAVVCRPGDDATTVADDWWQRAYVNRERV